MNTEQVRAFRKELRRFERSLNTQLKDCCGGSGVTMAQCHALMELDENKDITLIQLAENLSLDKSTLSRTVDGLVSIGLVRKVPHTKDRRYSFLKLTRQGSATCKRIHKGNDAYYQGVFKCLTADQRAPVVEHFQQLVEAILTHEKKGCCAS